MSNDVSFKNQFESIDDPKLEKQQIEEIVKITKQLLAKRYPSPMQKLRGVHPKSHGCVNAKFEILPNIKKNLRVGLFVRPMTYDAVIRYSNASTLIAHDLNKAENGSRGMAIKVLDIDGEVLLKDAGRASQDFLMINTPSFAFVNVGDYLRLNQILLANNDDPGKFFVPFFAAKTNPPTDPAKKAEVGRIAQSLKVLGEIKAKQVANPLEVAYFSGAPYMFGKNCCMHFSVMPQGGERPQKLPDIVSFNYLREALQKTMSGDSDVVYDFRVQVRKAGESDLFIEDATQSWDPEKYPPQTVARITIPAPQSGLDTPEHLEECEELVYTPSHSLTAHRPIGSINRLRYAVYIASSKHRLTRQG